MSRKFAFIFLLLFGLQTNGQNSYIQLTKKNSGKTRIYKEQTRIKIKTKEGNKYVGRLQIVDSQTIAIDATKIALEDIQKLKRKSIPGEIVSTVLFVGSALIFIASMDAIINDDSGIGVALGGAIAMPFGLLIGSTAVMMNDAPQNRTDSKWSYKIIVDD